MKRLAAFWPVFLFMFALSFAAPRPTSVVASPEDIRQRVQTALDEVAKKAAPRVLLIPIREDIELSTAVYVEREVKRVVRGEVDLVLVEIDTPGGDLRATWRIRDSLWRLLSRYRVPVVAFIDDKAYSAGAIISMSCDRVYIAPNGKVGAAAVITISLLPTGQPVPKDETREAKFLSAHRADVRALAKAKGYSPAVAQAMVDRMEVVTEVKIDGKTEYLTDREFTDRRRELGIDTLSPFEAEKRMKVVRTVCEEGELLTLDYEQAKAVGLATDVLESREAVFAAIGVKAPLITTAQHNWSEHFFGWFSSMAVRGILLLLGLMGLYMEFKVPGFGLPGTFGLICLGLFFFSQYFMGIADYTGVVVFLIGVVLLVIEIFVIPGFGITGITGIALVVVGLFLGMQDFIVPDFSSPLDMELFKTNVIVLGLALAGLVVAMALLAKFLPSTPFLKGIILTSQGPEGELRASGTIEPKGLVALGATGKTISRLRPAGRAAFGEKFLDVVAEGQFIGQGVSVEVIKIQGNRIVVREVE